MTQTAGARGTTATPGTGPSHTLPTEGAQMPRRWTNKHASTKPGRLKDLEDELHRRQANRRTNTATDTKETER